MFAKAVAKNKDSDRLRVSRTQVKMREDKMSVFESGTCSGQHIQDSTYSTARGDRPDRQMGGCWASPTLSRKLNRGT